MDAQTRAALEAIERRLGALENGLAYQLSGQGGGGGATRAKLPDPPVHPVGYENMPQTNGQNVGATD